MSGESQRAERTRARRALYSILSSAFYPPNSEVGEVWKGMVRASEQEEVAFEPLRDELEIEYNRLFVGPGKVPCSPYESVHRVDRPEMELGLVLGPSTLEVKRMYAEAGVSPAKGFRDLPDHIAVELEFMYFLCGRELETQGEETEKWRMMEREFVRSHLTVWVGTFTSKILSSTTSPFYRLSATLLDELVRDEAEYLDASTEKH